MLGSEVSDFNARSSWLIDKTDKFSHLINGEAEVSTSTDESQTCDGRLREISSTSIRPICVWQEANILVVADGRDRATRPFGNNAN